MDVWVLVMLFLAMTGYSEGANFCVCRGDVSQDALQKALDYACGAGADCSSIHDGGGCFQPNTVRAHCSYAANSYYQKKGQAQGSCEFNGAAKYRWALTVLKKPIVTISWIYQCWKEHRVVPQEMYRVLPFSGLTICVTRVKADLRKEMEKLILNNGGKYSADLTKKCT